MNRLMKRLLMGLSIAWLASGSGAEDDVDMTAQPLTLDSPTWTPSTPGPNRWDPSWTFLPTTCRGLAFGGIYRDGYHSETLLFDPVFGRWEQLTFQSSKRPSNRAGAGLSYDSVRSRAVLFGGHNGAGALRDTWTFDPVVKKWTKAIDNCKASVCPPARTLQGQVFSTVLGKTVVFGGLGPGLVVPLNDVWVFDGTWLQVSTTNVPPARSRFGMAEDATNGMIVVFGGRGSGDVVLSDTWILDPATLIWTKVPDGGLTPAGKFQLAMSYAPSLGGVVAHSGANAGENQTNETWAFDFTDNTWGSITTTRKPPPRTDARLAADTCNGQAILFGSPDARNPPPEPQRNYTWILQ